MVANQQLTVDSRFKGFNGAFLEAHRRVEDSKNTRLKDTDALGSNVRDTDCGLKRKREEAWNIERRKIMGELALSASLTLLRRGLVSADTLVRRRLLTALEIPSTDKSHSWVLAWISRQFSPFSKRGFRSHQVSVNTNLVNKDSGATALGFRRVPGEGTHFTPYRGASEAYELESKAVENRKVIWSALGAEWKPLSPPRRKRVLDSVVLDKGIKERILWRMSRRKSSFVQALAGTLSMDIGILNLSERGQTDDKLSSVLVNAPPRSIILLEDFDAAFNTRVQTSSDGYQSEITLSGQLKALDGVGGPESRMIFMTTNRPSTLDDATQAQVKVLFERFYVQPSVEEGEARLESMLKGRSVTMAALQGLFVISGDGPEMALRSLGTVLYQKREPI
ncbi:hypothetical protein CALVIDRAFT_588903 [Calocera viscosa TUFC12733]|uniref:BCS1 N-terminal domain-containing protein n=1 Tax=Calocera viscosa (strain TUFC12733) TaxID=1330018 RepID=A0A167H6W6_CALVF|nr:hypothetical protein CALVIDRAFT_588903 [Calocera viscosa TUFC12733]